MISKTFLRYLQVKWGQQNCLPAPQREGEEERRAPEFEVPRFEEKLMEERRPPNFEETKPPQPEPMKPKPAKEPWVSPYNKVEGTPDRSLGFPIDAARAQRWKDRMVLAYDRIKRDLTEMPFFQNLYKEMGSQYVVDESGRMGGSVPMHPVLKAFNNLMNSYVVNVANADLKDAFLYGIKYVEAFNELRDSLPSMIEPSGDKLRDIEKIHKLDMGIWSTQNFMWKRMKDLLNIHDIGSGDIGLSPAEAESAQKILGRLPRGTWTYGPMKNPTKPLMNVKNPVEEERHKRQYSMIEDPELRELLKREKKPPTPRKRKRDE